MKLAFNGEGRYAEFSEGYQMYLKRSRKGECVDQKTYNRIIRKYCSRLADRLCNNGIVDLPNEIGMIAAATITRKPQYRGKQFIGYGKMDWTKGHYDGTLKTFGLVFLPKGGKKRNNFRCYGFVANRKLFKRMKEVHNQDSCSWGPIRFNDEMI